MIPMPPGRPTTTTRIGWSPRLLRSGAPSSTQTVLSVTAAISKDAGWRPLLKVSSNTAVRKDDSLFNLDPEPYRIALANAEAQLGVARDQARTLIETYRARLKQIDEAKATADYAQTNYERQQRLF